MARIVEAKCPNCGASVKLDAYREVVTCAFCGASSFIQREGRPAPAHPPNAPVIVVPRASSAGLFVALAAVGAMVAGGVAAVVLFRTSSSSRPPRASVAAPLAPNSPSPKGAPAERISFLGQRVPMLVDVSGDGAPDLIAAWSAHDGKAMRYVYGAFDGRTGAPLWKTDDLGSPIYQAVAAVDTGRLFIADDKGQLFAYATRDGKKQWQTALGDKLTRFCKAPEPDALRVVTADARALVVDVRTGGQRPSGDKAPCAPIEGDKRPSYSPEPTGYPDATAPFGAEAWVCGGVRVMGDRNFTLADQCGPRMKINLSTIPGMGLSSIVRVPESDGWVLIGAKEPGTRVPMVGFLSKGKLAWTTVVPEGNPLEARAGRPDRIALARGMLVVPYAMNTSGAGRVAAFALDSGKRLWDVALPSGASAAEELATTKDTVFVAGRSYIAALSLADGSQRFVLGELR